MCKVFINASVVGGFFLSNCFLCFSFFLFFFLYSIALTNVHVFFLSDLLNNLSRSA